MASVVHDLDAALEKNEGLAKDIRAAAEDLEAEFRESTRLRDEEEDDTNDGPANLEPVVLRLPTARVLPVMEPDQKTNLVAHMRDWDYGPGGVFQRNDDLAGNALYHTTTQAVHRFDLCEKLSIDSAKLSNWVLAVQRCMRPQSVVPYHNAMHACDVVHAAYWFLDQAKLSDILAPSAQLAVLMAACAHDCGHPGLNNTWFVKTESDLALCYHDRSVLENFHIHQAFALMKNKDCDVFSGMAATEKQSIKSLITDAILATDLAYHNEAIVEFKQRSQEDRPFEAASASDQKILVTMTLKTADIANPSKSWPVYKPWIDRLFVEFYNQGDRERSQGHQAAPFMDRSDMSQSPPKAQQGFINYLMKPLFVEWSRLLPSCNPCMANVDANLAELKAWEGGVLAERGSAAGTTL